MCFHVPLPSSFWKPFFGEIFLLANSNNANNQTCQTHICLIIVITLSSSHPPWEICIPTSMCVFLQMTPCNHMSSQCWRGDESSIIPYALYGIGWCCNFQQRFGKFSMYFWGYLKIIAKNEGFWIYQVCFYFQFIKWGSLARSHMSNTAQFHFPSLEIIDSSR